MKKFWLSNKVNQEEALQSFGRLFFFMELVDQQQAQFPGDDGLVKITVNLWKDRVRPDILKVREALNRDG